MKQIAEHGSCFVCGSENPNSIGVKWYSLDDGTIRGEITLDRGQQGPPGYAHGGASAAILDEAMGIAVWHKGSMAAAVNISVDYLHPVPLDEKIIIKGKVTERVGKTIEAVGEISLPGGTIVVTATGRYVEAKHLFGKWAEGFQENQLEG